MRNTLVVAWCWLNFATASNGQIQFEDVSERAGIGEVGAFSISWLDYNNDGMLDLLVGGQRNGRVQVLFQDLHGRFTNRTAMTYLQGPYGYSQGTGDYDNDGNIDFLVTSPFETYSLFNNTGDGLFADVTDSAGVGIPDRGTSIRTGTSFADIDGDSWLDLFVGNEAGRDFVFRNEGNGRFADVTEGAQLDLPGGTRFHMFADIDNDRDPDLFVSHSSGRDVPDSLRGVPSALFRNEGDGTFTDIAQTAGINHSPGQIQGVSFFDYNNDGWLDLFIASGVPNEGTKLLFRNEGDGTFVEVGEQAGIRNPGTFADYTDVAIGDYDNDGWLDLFVASFDTGDQLFHNNGDGTFTDVTAETGIPTELVIFQVGTGDYDGDGFLDIFLSDMSGLERLLRNTGNTNHWLQVELVGVESNRSAIGARVHLVAGDLSMWREVNGGNGYGVDDLKAAFGLGNSTEATLVEIAWPSGKITHLENVAADQHIRVFEGREGYVAVEETIWEEALPDTMIAMADHVVQAVLRPALFSPDARTERVVADLSEFGGPARLPLDDVGDGFYRMQAVLAGAARNGIRVVRILVEQTNFLGSHQMTLLHPIVDLPEEDLSVFADELKAGWQQTLLGTAEAIPLVDSSTFEADGIWFVDFIPPQPIVQTGYQGLSFAIKPKVVADSRGAPRFTLGRAPSGNGCCAGLDLTAPYSLLMSRHLMGNELL